MARDIAFLTTLTALSPQTDTTSPSSRHLDSGHRHTHVKQGVAQKLQGKLQRKLETLTPGSATLPKTTDQVPKRGRGVATARGTKPAKETPPSQHDSDELDIGFLCAAGIPRHLAEAVVSDKEALAAEQEIMATSYAKWKESVNGTSSAATATPSYRGK
ncbi:MAG: hypothetical protein WCO00_12180 [Rhodospirillaceae bacterium]